MAKNIEKIFHIILFAGITLGIIVSFTINNRIYMQYEDNEIEYWSENIDKSDSGSVFVYTAILPDGGIADKIIAIETSHSSAVVTVGDTVIYSLEPKENSFIKTTGHCWNYIIMHDEYAGQPLTITISSVYNHSVSVPSIYFGRQDAITNAIVQKELIKFLISLIIFIIGIVMYFYSRFIVGRNTTNRLLHNFATFTILLGIWVFSDSSISALFLPWSVGNSFFTHLSLMLMPIPFLLFLKDTYQDRNNPLWHIYCYFNCIVVTIRLFLQLTGIADLRLTLFLTHISIIFFVLLVIYLSAKELITSKMTKQLRLNIICIFIIMLTATLDLVTYNITTKTSAFGAVGFLIYIIAVGTDTVKKSRILIQKAQESDVYRKLAYTDELTGLFNRTAFKRDVENIAAKDKSGNIIIPPTVIFMFDLNDLKKCNDNFGHEYGDQYISIASSAISQVFGADGRCYRIGGDEFCAIMPFNSQNDIMNKLNLFRKNIREKNRRSFVVPINIAAGYAVYNPEMDKTLDDTKNRADELMYRNKQELKNQLSK